LSGREEVNTKISDKDGRVKNRRTENYGGEQVRGRKNERERVMVVLLGLGFFL